MSDETQDAGSTKPFGECLSEARAALNLTLDELSESLNLDIGILQALEESAVEKLPPAIYVQGYIKAYTKALGISSKQIHLDYLQSVNDVEIVELKPRSPLPIETNSGSPVVKIISILFALLAVSAIVFAIYTYYSEKIVNNKLLEVENTSETQIKLPLKVDEIIITQDARLSEDGELLVGTNNKPDPEVVEVEVSDEKVVVKEIVEAEKITSNETITNQDTLIIKTTAKSWAEIRDANQNVMYLDNLKKDDYLILTGLAPFDVFFGNAPSVAIQVNEIEVDMGDYIRMNNVAHFKVSEQSNQIVFH